MLGSLTVGAAFAAVHFMTGGSTWETAGGWVLLASAFLAAYTAGAMDDRRRLGTHGPTGGEYRKAADVPGHRPTDPLEYELCEPGVRQGP